MVLAHSSDTSCQQATEDEQSYMSIPRRRVSVIFPEIKFLALSALKEASEPTLPTSLLDKIRHGDAQLDSAASMFILKRLYYLHSAIFILLMVSFVVSVLGERQLGLSNR
ncbi:hypothetical protein EON65_58545 [archaeon]|nr:MAG: hypothetical protein EON65_58545 [archaeon]